jgi:integrase
MAGLEDVRKPAIAATRLMIMTGWRRGEVLGLRWSEIVKKALKAFSCNAPARATEIIVDDRRD